MVGHRSLGADGRLAIRPRCGRVYDQFNSFIGISPTQQHSKTTTHNTTTVLTQRHRNIAAASKTTTYATHGTCHRAIDAIARTCQGMGNGSTTLPFERFPLCPLDLPAHFYSHAERAQAVSSLRPLAAARLAHTCTAVRPHAATLTSRRTASLIVALDCVTKSSTSSPSEKS